MPVPYCGITCAAGYICSFERLQGVEEALKIDGIVAAVAADPSKGYYRSTW